MTNIIFIQPKEAMQLFIILMTLFNYR